MSQYVKVSEYAEVRGVNRKTVYRWVENGDISAKDIGGILHVKVDGNNDKHDVAIEALMGQISHLQEINNQLQAQLSQALSTIDNMQQDRQRSDTIILSLTQQVEQLTGQNRLLLEDLRPKRRFWNRLFAWNGA